MLPESDVWAWVILIALALTGLIVLIQSQKESSESYMTDNEKESKEVILPDGTTKSWADFQADTEREEILQSGLERYKPLMDRLEKEGD